MDAPGLIALGILGAGCVVLGLALRPVWRRVRRARLRRRETMLLSTARARERLLWVNAFGSLAAGALLLGILQVELYRFLQQRDRAAELARIDRTCRENLLVLYNRGDAARRVRASEPVLLEYEGYLGERPDRWSAHFTDENARVLQPGEQLEIGFEASTPGACVRPKSGILQLTETFQRRTSCELLFDLELGGLHERVSCGVR
jgi:hypothetical protein